MRCSAIPCWLLPLIMRVTPVLELLAATAQQLEFPSATLESRFYALAEGELAPAAFLDYGPAICGPTMLTVSLGGPACGGRRRTPITWSICSRKVCSRVCPRRATNPLHSRSRPRPRRCSPRRLRRRGPRARSPRLCGSRPTSTSRQILTSRRVRSSSPPLSQPSSRCSCCGAFLWASTPGRRLGAHGVRWVL